MAARGALDLHELDLAAAGRARGLGVAAAELHRDGLVLHAVDDQRRYPQRQQADRIAGRVALGNLLGRAAHQIPHDPAVPASVGAGEIGDAGL